MKDTIVYIGRFQPLHAGHEHVIKEALKLTDKLIILVGSSHRARTPRNPFTFEERESMLSAFCTKATYKTTKSVTILPLRDITYNDDAWVKQVQQLVGFQPGTVGLIGLEKDESSYYLRKFPTWEYIAVPQRSVFDATAIRNQYFSSAPTINTMLCNSQVVSFMTSFMTTQEYIDLHSEAKFYSDYKKSWSNTPYPVIIPCVDSVVIQSGHILLVTRKEHPGKGLLALPGGHVNPKEVFRAAAIRELKEETRIEDEKGEIPPAMLASFIEDSKTRLFDDPYRSERGRVTTNAYLFRLPDRKRLWYVRGDDDASFATWYPLGSLDEKLFFEDHYHIIREMVGV